MVETQRNVFTGNYPDRRRHPNCHLAQLVSRRFGPTLVPAREDSSMVKTAKKSVESAYNFQNLTLFGQVVSNIESLYFYRRQA